jgi:hypothetical protein
LGNAVRFSDQPNLHDISRGATKPLLDWIIETSFGKRSEFKQGRLVPGAPPSLDNVIVMTVIIPLIDQDALPIQRAMDVKRTSSMKKHTAKPTAASHRYELVRGEDADFIAYQRHNRDGGWRTISSWMIPQTACR